MYSFSLYLREEVFAPVFIGRDAIAGRTLIGGLDQREDVIGTMKVIVEVLLQVVFCRGSRGVYGYCLLVVTK